MLVRCTSIDPCRLDRCRAMQCQAVINEGCSGVAAGESEGCEEGFAEVKDGVQIVGRDWCLVIRDELGIRRGIREGP